MHDSRGLIYSTTLHGIILLLLIIGLPDFFHRDVDMEPEAVSVEILPIAPVSNVKPQDNAPKAKVAQEEAAPKPRPEVRAKEPPKQDHVPLPVKPKDVVKPPPPKKEPPKPKPKNTDPLKSILEGVEKAAAKEGPKAEKTTTEASQKPTKSTHYDPGAPLSQSQKDAIVSQIENCWSPPVGAKNANNLQVTLHIEMNPDGSVSKREFIGDKGRYGSDSFFRAAVDSALRAVDRCSPLKNLPPEKYNVQDGWREMELNFDPKDVP